MRRWLLCCCLLLAFQVPAPVLAQAATARSDIACEPARPAEEQGCARGAACVQSGGQCGSWAGMCKSATDMMGACAHLCTGWVWRCEAYGALCRSDGECGGHGACLGGRCAITTQAAASGAACRPGSATPCPDGQGCDRGRCVPF